MKCAFCKFESEDGKSHLRKCPAPGRHYAILDGNLALVLQECDQAALDSVQDNELCVVYGKVTAVMCFGEFKKIRNMKIEPKKKEDLTEFFKGLIEAIDKKKSITDES